MVSGIRNTFTYMNKTIFKRIYPSLIHIQLEYAVQAWTPQLNKDIILL